MNRITSEYIPMKEETLIRFIQGDALPEEQNAVSSWLAESPEHKEEFYKLKNLWALICEQSTLTEAREEDIRTFTRNLRAKRVEKLKSILLKVTRYAAVFALAFFAGNIFVKHSGSNSPSAKFNEINVPAGQMAQLTLSDGTHVSINSCSNLKYPASFESNERRVRLSGEAYFVVAKDTKAPFIVQTQSHSVKVVGTSFNVMAYPQSESFAATLVEGEIWMTDNFGNELARLRPGEQFAMDSTSGKYRVKDVKTDLFTSWKDGLYQFDHEPLNELADYLERIFAVKINIRSQEIKNFRFTGTISRNVPFEQIIKIIQISSPIRYELKENHGAITEADLYKN